MSTVGFKGSSTEIVAGLLPPFETMLFAVNEKGYTDYNDLYCERYYSEEEAIRRHGELLEKAESGEKFWKEGDGE